MGIGGLVGWARKAYPEAFTSYPKRWAAPEIRGKRVAIDATLMTNRFHFATSGEEYMRGKGAIVGWYNLISLMRAHKVQPIAIWDKPGKRDWKELETRKRLYIRAQHLARRAHEDHRADRLHALRGAIGDLEELSREEQECVRDHWVKTRFLGGALDLPMAVSTLSSACEDAVETKEDAKPLEEDGSPLENVTSTIDTFSEILRKYRLHVQSTSGKGVQPNDPTLEHIRELEDLEEELGPASSMSADGSARGEEEGVEEGDEGRRLVDEEIEQTLGTDNFPESRTQLEMTMEEGEIITSILTPLSPGSPIPKLPSSTEDRPPAARLDALIGRLPVVKAIYDRALSTPSATTHLECRQLLERMGIPVLLASSPFEAEGLASALAREGRVDFVGTEDSDVVAYEAPLLKNVTSSRLPLELLSPSRLRAATRLSEETFLDFCVMCGTDASPRIPGVGPSNALKLLKKHGSIEVVLEKEKNVREKVGKMDGGMEGWMVLVRNARELFKTMPPVGDELILDAKEGGLGEAEMERWLEDRHGISLVEKGAEGEGEAKVEEVHEDSEHADTDALPLAQVELQDHNDEPVDFEVEDLHAGDEGSTMTEEDWKDFEDAFKNTNSRR